MFSEHSYIMETVFDVIYLFHMPHADLFLSFRLVCQQVQKEQVDNDSNMYC